MASGAVHAVLAPLNVNLTRMFRIRSPQIREGYHAYDFDESKIER